jgi:hypothetical protein
MGIGLKRTELRATAQAKLDDALLLLNHKRYSNAYYLAGYAVEIGLKACIAAQVSAETIPDKYFIQNILNHQFSTLIGLAGLATVLKENKDNDADFAANWAVCSEWSPDSRYVPVDPTSSQYLIAAITAKKSGVFEWIKIHW